MVKQGIMLGHVVSYMKIVIGKLEIGIITALSYPKSVREVRSFLSHAGFYRIYIKDFSKITAPLCKLLQKEAKFNVNEEYKAAFDKLKQLLTTPPIINPPNWDLPFEVMCGASDYVVGLMIGQRVGEAHDILCYKNLEFGSSKLYYNCKRTFSCGFCFIITLFIFIWD